jgi:hypothetical protein
VRTETKLYRLQAPAPSEPSAGAVLPRQNAIGVLRQAVSLSCASTAGILAAAGCRRPRSGVDNGGRATGQRSASSSRAMVELERAHGFDHGKDAPGRENRKPLTR